MRGRETAERMGRALCENFKVKALSEWGFAMSLLPCGGCSLGGKRSGGRVNTHDPLFTVAPRLQLSSNLSC